MQLLLLILATVAVMDCSIYINRYVLNTDLKICNASLTLKNNTSGELMVNATFRNFKTITKLLGYVKVMIAEDDNDRTFKREFLSTVFDAEKMVNGMQGNIILKRFGDIILKSLDFEFKAPFLPVSFSSILKLVLLVCL